MLKFNRQWIKDCQGFAEKARRLNEIWIEEEKDQTQLRDCFEDFDLLCSAGLFETVYFKMIM